MSDDLEAFRARRDIAVVVMPFHLISQLRPWLAQRQFDLTLVPDSVGVFYVVRDKMLGETEPFPQREV